VKVAKRDSFDVTAHGSRRDAVAEPFTQQTIAAMLARARALVADVYGGDAQVGEAVVRREIVDEGSYLLVPIEVPPMTDEEFTRKYDAFTEALWSGSAVDPSAITFAVQTRDAA
jgi:hypothetical protein